MTTGGIQWCTQEVDPSCYTDSSFILYYYYTMISQTDKWFMIIKKWEDIIEPSRAVEFNTCYYDGKDINKPSRAVEFNVYYYDRSYRLGKRYTLSITCKSYEYHDNGLVVSSFMPMENGNLNIVLEKIKRYNDKKMRWWIKKIQDNAERLEFLYNEWQHKDLYDFVITL